jgi:hypothetical protein
LPSTASTSPGFSRGERQRKTSLARCGFVAIDCDLTKTDTTPLVAERWDDVPKVSEDLPGATRAIRRHVEKLVQEMAEPQSSRYAWAEDIAAPKDWPSSSVRTCIPP